MTVLGHYVVAISLAGWAAELVLPLLRFNATVSETGEAQVAGRRAEPSVAAIVWVAVAAYVVVFTVMNWQLYRGLLVPHGDSVMYEEHLFILCLLKLNTEPLY